VLALAAVLIVIVMSVGRSTPRTTAAVRQRKIWNSSTALGKKELDKFVALWTDRIQASLEKHDRLPQEMVEVLRDLYWSEAQWDENQMYVAAKWEDPREKNSVRSPNWMKGHEAWYFLPFMYTCATITRVGLLFGSLYWPCSSFPPPPLIDTEPTLDGGKFICNPHRLVPKECVIYSFGVNYDISFDEDAYARWRKSFSLFLSIAKPNLFPALIPLECVNHMFEIKEQTYLDMYDRASEVGTIHHVGLGATNSLLGDMKSLPTLMGEIGHDHLDILVLLMLPLCFQVLRYSLRKWISKEKSGTSSQSYLKTVTQITQWLIKF